MTISATTNGHVTPDHRPDHPVVLFDGCCNLCSAAVNFIMKHDSRDRFRFASLQSPVAADLLHQHGLPSDLDTVVAIVGGHAFTHSTAVLRIAAELDSPWPLAAVGALVPKHLRDGAYEFVSKHRDAVVRPSKSNAGCRPIRTGGRFLDEPASKGEA